MLNFTTAMERTFRPQYSFSWYVARLFMLVVAGTYITSKLLGEPVGHLIESLGIGAFAMAAYSTAFTVKAVEFGPQVRLRYVFWPAKVIEYKAILEIRLPEIAIAAQNPIKLENIVNLDELQQEFKSLEMMGVLERGRIREPKPLPSQYGFKPKLGGIIWVVLTAFALGSELFRIFKEANILWTGIIGIYFASEIFSRLFGKSKDE